MMVELGENAPVYSLLPLINNDQMLTHCVIPFGFRKGKTGNLNYQLRAISRVFFNQFTQY